MCNEIKIYPARKNTKIKKFDLVALDLKGYLAKVNNRNKYKMVGIALHKSKRLTGGKYYKTEVQVSGILKINDVNVEIYKPIRLQEVFPIREICPCIDIPLSKKRNKSGKTGD